MKNNSSLFVLALATLLGLSACGGSNSDTSSASDSASDTSATSDTSSGDTSSGDTSSGGSSETPISTYAISISNPTGVLITSDKERATPGDTVNLSITVSTGYTLTDISVNGTSINWAGNSASFTMPGRDAIITGTSAFNADAGDIVVGGVVSAPLEKEGDLFVARDVTVATGGYIYIAIYNEEGTGFTPLGWSHYNKRRSFGSVDFAYGEGDEMDEYSFPEGADYSTNPGESLLDIEGNATYDIYYDPSDSDTPIYIQRTKVAIPTTVAMLEEVFVSAGTANPSYHPEGVTSVTYSDSRAGQSYSWHRYENSAQATITDTLRDTSNYVYKAYDASSATVTVVDDYVMGKSVTSPYPYSGGTSTEYLNPERSDDQDAYSAHYLVQNNAVAYEDEDKAIKMSRVDAESLITEYEHDVCDIDFAIYRGYRSGFTIEDDLVAANVSITSAETDEGFSVNVSSYKTYDPTSTSSTYATMSSAVHIEYTMNLTFTEAGAPLTGSYLEEYFDSTSYDFTTMTKTGTGNVAKKVTYAYTYDETITGEAPLDTTPYFAESVTAKISGTNGDNLVQGGWRSDLDDEPLEITLAPSTALDVDQFDIISSSDESVIAYTSSYGSWMASSVPGTTTLTIGNIVTGTPSVAIDVTVEKTAFKSLYLNIPSTDVHYAERSDRVALYSNETYTTRLYNNGEEGNGATYGDFSDIVVASSNEAVCTATVNAYDRTITFVTGEVTEQTSVTLTLNSDNYAEGWPTSTITAIVSPTKASGYTESDMYGTWNFVENPGVNSLILNSDGTGSFYFNEDFGTSTGGTVYGTIEATVTFSWSYSANTGFSVSGAKIAWTTGGRDWDYTSFSIAVVESEEGALNIGVALYGEIWSWGGADEASTTIEYLYGTIEIDDDDSVVISEYDPMEKVS